MPRKEYLGLLGLVIAALGSSALAAVAPQQRTQCDPATLGREYRGDAVPGVPLIAGLQTGMTRAEVKRIAPRLSVFESRHKFELLPGLAFKAWAGFKNVFGPLETIGLSGTAVQAPGDALTKHFGLPIRLDGGIRTMENPGTTMPAVLISRYSVEKWCDGPRVFILHLDEDKFTLTVSGPRTKR